MSWYGAGRWLLLTTLWSCTSARAAPAARVVVVFDIDNQGAALSPHELAGMTDYLGTRLGEGGTLRIVPRSEIRERLRDGKQESYKRCYDQRCQIEIGKELAAQQMVSARITRIGSRCVITAALYDLRLAASVQAASAEADCSADALLKALSQVAKGLVRPPQGGPVAAPPRVERIIERHVIERTYERKSVLTAVVLSGLPGGGMYYVGRWGWGLTYTIGIVTGMGLMAGGFASMADGGGGTATLAAGLVLFYGGYIGSAVHAGVSASNWRPPGDKGEGAVPRAVALPLLRGVF